MTFVDARELRRRKIEALEHELAATPSTDDRARIEAELRDLRKFRWRRFLWPGGPHGS